MQHRVLAKVRIAHRWENWGEANKQQYKADATLYRAKNPATILLYAYVGVAAVCIINTSSTNLAYVTAIASMGRFCNICGCEVNYINKYSDFVL